MSRNRRELLKEVGAAGLLALLPGFGAPEQAQAARAPLKLPKWSHGGNSFADDTVLMFRGNPSHTFYGTGPVPDKPRIIWKQRLASLKTITHGKPVIWAGTGWTGTAVKQGDYVFVGSAGGYVYAFEAATGKPGWRYGTNRPRMYKGSPCLWDNKLYIGNTDNRLHCIDASTGKSVWKFDTGRDLDSSPCVVDGRLYIAGENGHARCIDPLTGKQIWKTFVGGIGPGTLLGSNGSETSPAIADGDFYTATYDGILFCIDIRDGRIKWKTRTHDDTDASPVVAGDFVYAAAEEKASYLFCFEREKGREIWRYGGNKMGYWSTPAYANGRLYVGGDDFNLHCVDATSGAPVWTFKTGAGVWSSPCVVDDKVVFGGRDAHLYVVDANSGKEISRVRVDGRIISSPCIVDGTIWVGTATGWFYCFGA